MKLHCPHCVQKVTSKVLYTKNGYRRRECLQCKGRWNTTEIISAIGNKKREAIYIEGLVRCLRSHLNYRGCDECFEKTSYERREHEEELMAEVKRKLG